MINILKLNAYSNENEIGNETSNDDRWRNVRPNYSVNNPTAHLSSGRFIVRRFVDNFILM